MGLGHISSVRARAVISGYKSEAQGEAGHKIGG
jgi:hypothetical protein